MWCGKRFPILRHACLMAAVFLASPAALRADETEAFGSRDKSPGTLIATLYDLKQTQDRQPTHLTNNSYAEVCSEFLKDDWNEAVLNRYFRVTQPLYATQVYFPGMLADVAPKAFGVESIVEPMRWVVHYKGQVSPPESGRYRLAGYADNWMATAINGQTVLIARRGDTDVTIPSFQWTADRMGQQLLNGELTYGNWMDLKKGVPVDIDIAVGESAGGSFCGVLLVQKEGDAYEMSETGFPILPLFQLTPKKTIPPTLGSTPAFSLGKPWTGLP